MERAGVGIEQYAWARNDPRLDAFCFTAVVGVPRERVVAGFLADAATRTETTFEDAFNDFPLAYVMVDDVAGGLLGAEHNGWQGVQEDVASRISRGGELASFYRNVNAVMTFVHAVDGVVLAMFDPLLEDVPESLLGHVEGLDFAGSTEASAFVLLERLTGIGLREEWLVATHSRYDVPSPL